MTREKVWSKPGYAAWTFAVLPALLLASCSSSSPSTGKGDSQADSAAVQFDASVPAELIVQELSGGTEEKFNENYGNMIRKKFPNYTLKFVRWDKGTTLPELIAAGQRVDLVLSSVNTLMQRLTGSEYDVTELIKKHNVNLSLLEAPVIDGMRAMFDGKMYAVPITQVKQAMFYNKDLFGRFGVPYPQDGLTWDETAEIAKKMTRADNGKQILGFAASPVHNLSSNQLSKPYLDPKTLKPTFLDKEWQTLYETYFLQFARDSTYKNRTTALKRIPYRVEFAGTQEIAMFAFNSQFPFDVTKEDLANLNWDLTTLPVFAASPRLGSQSLPITMGMTSMAKNKDAAMAVLKFMISEEAQMELSKKGFIPALKSDSVKKLLASETIYKEKNWASVFKTDFAALSYKSIYDSQIQTYAQDTARDLVTGVIPDLNTAMRQLQEKTEKYIEGEKKK
ncbi:MAG: extracellular solute-binding protein family 1 [Paenibacillus sp.]|nr:extracellular solute-binding protein family 1 [Paenibacillus sp.]